MAAGPRLARWQLQRGLPLTELLQHLLGNCSWGGQPQALPGLCTGRAAAAAAAAAGRAAAAAAEHAAGLQPRQLRQAEVLGVVAGQRGLHALEPARAGACRGVGERAGGAIARAAAGRGDGPCGGAAPGCAGAGTMPRTWPAVSGAVRPAAGCPPPAAQAADGQPQVRRGAGALRAAPARRSSHHHARAAAAHRVQPQHLPELGECGGLVVRLRPAGDQVEAALLRALVEVWRHRQLQAAQGVGVAARLQQAAGDDEEALGRGLLPRRRLAGRAGRAGVGGERAGRRGILLFPAVQAVAGDDALPGPRHCSSLLRCAARAARDGLRCAGAGMKRSSAEGERAPGPPVIGAVDRCGDRVVDGRP
jgi:hypothetical protein